jgi:hypothetical protein
MKKNELHPCNLMIYKTSLRNDRAYVWTWWTTSCQPIVNRLSGLVRKKNICNWFFPICSQNYTHGSSLFILSSCRNKNREVVPVFHFLRVVASLLLLVPGMGCRCWRKECLLLTRWEIWKRKIESLFLLRCHACSMSWLLNWGILLNVIYHLLKAHPIKSCGS